MDKDTALRLALEALEYRGTDSWRKRQPAIAAIKAALEANEFNPDWDTQAVLTEEIQRMAKRIEELEAQRKPLTDETRNWIVATCPTPRHIIDAVERMHGIKGEA